MKKIFSLLFCLLVFIMQTYSQTPTKKVAILETVDKENVISYGVKLMVRSKLTWAITNTPGYEGYDRVDMASIMSEHDFQRTGLVSDEQIKRLGEMTGAEYILVAEVAMLDHNHIIIVSKILSVETARIVRTSNIQTATDVGSMESACQELAAKLLGVERGRSITIAQSEKSNPGHNSPEQDFIETAAGLNMKMVYVEGGEFQMGATSEQGSDGDRDEQPVRRVKLDGYYIGECEVTQDQWEKVMGTSVSQQRNKANRDWPLHGVGPDYPMYYVSWEEAMAFCQELSSMTGRNYSLPTEAQWEYAARGGKKSGITKYSGGSSLDAIAWYSGNSSSSTHPVKSKRANALGLYDMSGNVYEWCKDWYSNNYNINSTNNPDGPPSGSNRVLRGGSWSNYATYCRVSHRARNSSGYCGYDYGFRVIVLP